MKSAARAVFQNNELLRHLDSAGIDRVAQLATRRSYDQGATIFAEGDPADAIYGVISGQVQISARTSTNEEIFLDAYGSGRIFGLISGIDGLLRCATARAAPAAEVFVHLPRPVPAAHCGRAAAVARPARRVLPAPAGRDPADRRRVCPEGHPGAPGSPGARADRCRPERQELPRDHPGRAGQVRLRLAAGGQPLPQRVAQPRLGSPRRPGGCA